MILDIIGLDLETINFFPKTIIEEVIQNISIILTTTVGTVPLDRRFGLTVNVLDNPINIAKSKLSIYILESIQDYEPRVEVLEIDFKVDVENTREGKLYPAIKVKVKNEFCCNV